jgi:hypothetical protein
MVQMIDFEHIRNIMYMNLCKLAYNIIKLYCIPRCAHGNAARKTTMQYVLLRDPLIVFISQRFMLSYKVNKCQPLSGYITN